MMGRDWADFRRGCPDGYLGWFRRRQMSGSTVSERVMVDG